MLIFALAVCLCLSHDAPTALQMNEVVCLDCGEKVDRQEFQVGG